MLSQREYLRRMNRKDLAEELRRIVKKGGLKRETPSSFKRVGIPQKQMKMRNKKKMKLGNL